MEQTYNIDPNIQYDVVELASRGIYYQNKTKTLRVSYLTAADENIMTSPNLIATGKVVDELLKRKILDKDKINVEELVEEDRQTIMIFLRNTAFGSDYKLKVEDPKTKEMFEVDVDLSEISFKEFDLVENENGEYEYFLEVSKKKITFSFLNKAQEKYLDDMVNNWDVKKFGSVVPTATKRLELLIKSIDGNREPMAIHNFISKMPFKDSKNFQKFVQEKKPSLDLIREVNTPSGEKIQVEIGFGVDFFRPFYGL